MPRAKFDYSNRPGHTIYPVLEGTVIKLDNPRKITNPKVKLVLEHDVFIWITRMGIIPKGKQPKRQKVYIITCLVPKVDAFKNRILVKRSSVQKEYITRLMYEGYTMLSHDCPFHYSEKSWRKFYRTIGVPTT